MFRWINELEGNTDFGSFPLFFRKLIGYSRPENPRVGGSIPPLATSNVALNRATESVVIEAASRQSGADQRGAARLRIPPLRDLTAQRRVPRRPSCGTIGKLTDACGAACAATAARAAGDPNATKRSDGFAGAAPEIANTGRRSLPLLTSA